MRTDFFAAIVKNEGKTGKMGKTAEILIKNSGLPSNPRFTQPGKSRVRWVRNADEEKTPTNDLARLTPLGKSRVRNADSGNAKAYNNLAGVLPVLPNLPEKKIDNVAISHALDDEVFEERAAIIEHDGGLTREEAERKAAAANRQSMPIIAEVVDQFRSVFGENQVKVISAEENGRKMGKPPATEPAPRQQQENTHLIAECRTCLRHEPRTQYCGHKLRLIREGENVICAGKGYSPKGSPWKECQS